MIEESFPLKIGPINYQGVETVWRFGKPGQWTETRADISDEFLGNLQTPPANFTGDLL
jgi:hypothetical protein